MKIGDMVRVKQEKTSTSIGVNTYANRLGIIRGKREYFEVELLGEKEIFEFLSEQLKEEKT